MNENTENIRIDEVLEELYHLREENQGLKIDNDFLDRQNRALKLRCSKYAIENRELSTEVSELRFTNKCLLSEGGA
jgi:hypothetical protein